LRHTTAPEAPPEVTLNLPTVLISDEDFPVFRVDHAAPNSGVPIPEIGDLS